ncbi:MAG: hypothetical protein NC311_16165 [Muribaculaceae bacterium]|nr:hypothetical protein [Muribaculaceae bacterium]MCM1440776.1 hypothetical protein [Roseburia sp.]
MNILYIFILAVFAIAGSFYISGSCAFVFYIVSLCCIFIGLILVYCASIYQKRQYAKELNYKQNKIIKGYHIENIKYGKFKKFIDYFLKYRSFPTQKQIFVLFFIVSIIICLVPYKNWNGADGVLDILNTIRLTMQMFVIGGDVDGALELNQLPTLFKGISNYGILLYNIYTVLLAIVASLIFTFKVISLFVTELKSYIDYWIAHPLSNIFVMSKLNENSIILAESIFTNQYCCKDQTQKRCTKHDKIYFCDVYSDNKENVMELIERAKRLGAVIMKKDISRIKIKKWCKSNKFYMISDSEEENVEQAQQICASNDAQRSGKRLEIYIYASRSESEFVIDSLHENKYKNVDDNNEKK